jgi:2-polyprenyl-3-methyl-5-hydroxy-6-metoxy-1,4-benzoquinol methylase
MNKTDKILNVGCGSSRMSEEMYEEGYENIINIDFSPKVIVKWMKEQNQNVLKWFSKRWM